jgi:hypothetical protein
VPVAGGEPALDGGEELNRRFLDAAGHDAAGRLLVVELVRQVLPDHLDGICALLGVQLVHGSGV